VTHIHLLPLLLAEAEAEVGSSCREVHSPVVAEVGSSCLEVHIPVEEVEEVPSAAAATTISQHPV